jgi:hypothetical protein
MHVMFIFCSDVMCGQLLCAPTSNLVNFATLSLLTVIAAVGGSVCNSTVIDAGTQLQSPAMVPNGAQCGLNKVTFVGIDLVQVTASRYLN